MAQLYKMTLYVCDLEDALSLNEIKTLIKQDAPRWCCRKLHLPLCRRTGWPQVEWDDDINLNYLDCPTSTWEKYFEHTTQN